MQYPLNSIVEMCFLGRELQIDAKNSNFDIFENALWEYAFKTDCIQHCNIYFNLCACHINSIPVRKSKKGFWCSLKEHLVGVLINTYIFETGPSISEIWQVKRVHVLHPWALVLKTLCIFSKIKATSDNVSYGSGQKGSKELKNHSFTSVETIVVKLKWKMCENQYFPCFEP